MLPPADKFLCHLKTIFLKPICRSADYCLWCAADQNIIGFGRWFQGQALKRQMKKKIYIATQSSEQKKYQVIFLLWL
jgi:hypothetical protein